MKRSIFDMAMLHEEKVDLEKNEAFYNEIFKIDFQEDQEIELNDKCFITKGQYVDCGIKVL